ncbi:MAG TPA: hypothetical protein VMN58_01520 [Acidimicrobiales bacterium]|nr:hypothetical protein [Acidimicrobiales bacterium]
MTDQGPSSTEGEGRYARDASGLEQLLDGLRADGYTGDMTALEGGDVRCGSCGATSPAGSFHVGELRRTEGASDPADMAAVVGLTCPRCDAKGALVTMFGPEADIAAADVLSALGPPDEIDTGDR